jgi:hypothetical protein
LSGALWEECKLGTQAANIPALNLYRALGFRTEQAQLCFTSPCRGISVNIGRHDLDEAVFIIAEIGNNHEGDIQLAQEMIHAAAAAGVQAVKFQTIIPERLVAKSQSARIAQLNRFAFSPDQFADLAAVAAKVQVEFLSTPFAPEVVPWLDGLVPAFKVASGDNNYSALLDGDRGHGQTNPVIDRYEYPG